MPKKSSTPNSKYEKWTTDQIELLINAYKDETFLYETSHVNYYNKYLRGKAIERVCKQIKTLRPATTPKECLDKLQNLRNKFNIEHSKVRASHKKGTDTDEIYQPALWYYPKLLFLAAYLKPRKRRGSLQEKDEDRDSQQAFSDIETSQSNIKTEIEVQDESLELDATPMTYLHSVSPNTSHSDVQQYHPVVIPCDPVALESPMSPSPTASQSISQSPSKKRRRSSPDADYASILRELVELAKRPITINTTQSSDSNSNSSLPVNSFVNFLGSLLQSFQDEKLMLELMNNITQAVISAKATDLERAKK